MRKHLFILLLLIGCTPTHGQSCEYCGKWLYAGFEYASRITADCQNIAYNFENTNIAIGENYFNHTYSIDNTPKDICDVGVIKIPLDKYENVPAILILKDNKIVQKLYISAPNKIYMLLDGCRFYFDREN